MTIMFNDMKTLNAHVREQTKNNARVLSKVMKEALSDSVQENVYDTPEGRYRRTESLKNIKSEVEYKNSNRSYSRVYIASKSGTSPTSLFGQEGIGVKRGQRVYTAWWIDGTIGKKGNGGFMKVHRPAVNSLAPYNQRNFTNQAIGDIIRYIKDEKARLRAEGIVI